jgi:hypothetical protein
VKKVLKLSSLLAAVLLLTVLAGVQLLTAQSVRTSVDVEMDYVSNDADATNTFVVTIVDADERGLRIGDDTNRFATVTVENITREARPDDKGKPGNEVDVKAGGALPGDDDAEDGSAAKIAFSTASTTVSVFASTTDAGYIENEADADLAGTSIIAEHGDRIRVRYVPLSGRTRTDEIVVDAEGPVITSQTPAHETRTKAEAVAFVAEFKDDGAGLGKMADVDADTVLTLEGESEDFKVTDLEDGNWRIRAVILLDEGDVEWQVMVEDVLGNVTASIAVKEDEETEETDEVTRHLLTVDTTAPIIMEATTGDTLDTSEDDPVVKQGSSRTAIAVKFNEKLDGSTVQASDFRVEVDEDEVDIADVTAGPSGKQEYVFITLEDELAGDDEPTVKVVGAIEDIAGNAQTTIEEDAGDGIAPMVTVSVDGSADTVTNDKLTVLASADEKSRNPSRTNGITVSAVEKKGGEGDDADTDVVGDAAGFSAARFRTVTSGEQWEWIFNLANATNGTYNVCIEVSDISGDTGNEGTKGTCKAGDPIDADKSITFTVDTVVNDPAVTPEKTDNGGAFIEVDLSGEAGEYTGDSQGKIAALTVTIGGDAVDTATLDDKKFTVAPPADGYSVGKLEIVVVATDAAGNTGTFKDITVEITERAAFTVNLRPGYNLISLPGTPESTDINDVIGADHSINQVLTYSPFVEGGWLSAERGDDGTFAGTLTTIDGSTAYIVRTSSFEALEVAIPRTAAGNVLPPQTNLGVGWNLVPVIDLSSDLDTGDAIADYFQGVGEAILTIDDSGRLTAIEGDDATVGKGYWIYASRPAVLLPTRR